MNCGRHRRVRGGEGERGGRGREGESEMVSNVMMRGRERGRQGKMDKMGEGEMEGNWERVRGRDGGMEGDRVR